VPDAGQMRPRLAPELREFIYRYCSTVPALEAMVLLQGRADVAWTAEALGEAMGHPEAADLLAAFHWQGFLNPSSPAGRSAGGPSRAGTRSVSSRRREAAAPTRGPG
jgi:hypothetical protein